MLLRSLADVYDVAKLAGRIPAPTHFCHPIGSDGYVECAACRQTSWDEDALTHAADCPWWRVQAIGNVGRPGVWVVTLRGGRWGDQDSGLFASAELAMARFPNPSWRRVEVVVPRERAMGFTADQEPVAWRFETDPNEYGVSMDCWLREVTT